MGKNKESDFPDEYRNGFAMFLGCRIDLSARPLIPRPETEFWVERAIGDLKNLKRSGARALDIFSGSGCAGIAVAKHLPGIRVDFSDIDPGAVGQIKINIRENNICPELANAFEGGFFNKIPKGILYDAILANPPYIDPARIGQVQKSVLDYEPRQALFSGNGGLEAIEIFLAQAGNFLRPEGFIYLEFDPSQKRRIAGIIREKKYSSFQFFKDQFSRWRFVKIIK